MAESPGREFFPKLEDESEAETLLREWASWWINDEHSPSKMPNSLHTRTAVYFVTRKQRRERERRENGL